LTWINLTNFSSSHVKDGCSKSSDIKASSPVSISEHTYQIPSSPMGTYNEEVDFPLYPNPPHMFLQPFNFSAMYAEAPHIESPGLGGDPSKYCTAPAPSASSSAMGSPHSIHDNVLAVPEWSTHGLGLDHSIVGHDSFGNREYTLEPTGMDDFTLNFSLLAPNKPPLVDPTLIHPLSSSVKSRDLAAFPPPQYLASPAVSRSPRPVKQGNQSPYRPTLAPTDRRIHTHHLVDHLLPLNSLTAANTAASAARRRKRKDDARILSAGSCSRI
jgi:hypothetical protein